MNKLFLCFLVFAITLSSFKDDKREAISVSAPSDEHEIITLAINTILPGDTPLEKAYLFEHRFWKYDFDDVTKNQAKRDSMMKQSYQQHQRKLDTLKKAFEIAPLCVFLDDTLNNDYLNTEVKTFNKTEYLEEIKKNRILKTWAKEIKMNNYYSGLKDLNIESLDHRFTYVFTSQQKPLSAKTIAVGFINISSVFFNSKKNKALVCADFLCSSLYATRNFIFLEKGPVQWSVVKKERSWLDAVIKHRDNF